MTSEALDKAGDQATWWLNGTSGRHSWWSGQVARSVGGIRPQ
jgi:hypothetical protein